MEHVLALFIHFGYLTYNTDTKTTKIPNEEMLWFFKNAMGAHNYSECSEHQLEDSEYFEKNFRELWKIYGDCYLLISNKQVIGSFNKFHDAVEEGMRLFGPGNFIATELTNDESCFTIEL